MDLSELVKNLKPNIVTPHIDEILKANPAARANIMARHIIRGMVKQRGKIEPTDILHGGTIQTVRFLDVEPLCEGPWALYSLLLLSVSYGEQFTIIEAMYPEKKQLPAKAFAALFSHDAPGNIKQQDNDVLQALESANAGIAMILARIEANGGSLHADAVGKQLTAMQQLAKSAAERDKYHRDFKKSQEAFKKGDK